MVTVLMSKVLSLCWTRQQCRGRKEDVLSSNWILIPNVAVKSWARTACTRISSFFKGQDRVTGSENKASARN